MQDQAYALRKPWRSLSTLRTELSTRGIQGVKDMKKPDLQEKLDSILEGAQRVPSVLTPNPTQSLFDINLQDYEILDCEPLHDLKGHLLNILPEVPKLLSQPLKTECQNIIDVSLTKQKVSGAVLRTAAINLQVKVNESNAPDKVKQLLETIVRISEIN